MCKPVTLVIKNQVLQNLSCRSNGMKSKMDLCPLDATSLSSDLIKSIDLKLEDSDHYEKETNKPQVESSVWKGKQEENETCHTFQESSVWKFPLDATSLSSDLIKSIDVKSEDSDHYEKETNKPQVESSVWKGKQEENETCHSFQESSVWKYPLDATSLSSDLIKSIDLKSEDSDHYEKETNKPQVESSVWKGKQEEDETCHSFQESSVWKGKQEENETCHSFQGAVGEDPKNNEFFKMVEDISNEVNMTPPINASFEENLINSMRPDSKAIVDDLIEKINQLSIIQKMLLYLKLPSPSEDADYSDPLRRPLNPLGNRQEVSQALAYIRTHFQPDPDVSLPKKEIYNEYVSYCSSQKIKPLSTADFGKAMKQVYPVVRPRRLGERGNSRYCYSGLSNRTALEKPCTPSSAVARDAVSRKICSWASKVLNVKVNNLTELSNIIPSEPQSNSTELSENKNIGSFQTYVSSVLEGKKRKIELKNAQNEEPRSCKQRKTSDVPIKGQRTYDSKSSKTLVRTSSAQSLRGETKVIAIAGPSNVCDNTNQKQIDVDMLNIKHLVVNNIDLKPEMSTNLGKKKRVVYNKKSTPKKTQRGKKKTIEMSDYDSKGSSKRETLDSLPVENGFTIASIEEDPSLEELQYSLKGNTDSSNVMKFSRNEVVVDKGETSDLKNVKIFNETSVTRDCSPSDGYNDIGFLTTEGLGHYLQDEGNSQEPEEELLKYFKDPVKSEHNNFNLKDTSQLRLLLEQNVSEETGAIYDNKFSERDTGFSEDDSNKPKEMSLKSYVTSPQESPQKSSFLSSLQNGSSKRRVSFENIPDSFPQSPNTCSKNFSFTPISPRPPTISKSMVNVSPFVFPRETVFRGKLVTGNNGSHQTPVPSPVSRSHVSPHKGPLRSASLSSTPSPVASGRPEHSDSLISPSSSSGVFLSPASPISSCNSPIFIFRKNMSPVKQDDSKITKSNSLLQSLLLTGKCTESKPSNTDYNESHFKTVQKETEPLAIDVQFQYPNGQNLSSFRSQSVPTLTNNTIVSPSSNTLPFPDSAFDKETHTLLEIKPNDLDVLDTVLKSSENNLLIENMSDNDTLESGIHTVGNDVSMESVISNLCDFLSDKGLPSPNEHVRVTQASRSQPNTPLDYNESSNSSRDPVVSAFAISSVSKSYPSTPAQPFNGVKANINFSTKRNINPLLDSLSNHASSLSDDIDLHLNHFADLSACDDAFNQLAKEVASSDKDL